jgi:hypothetical protein
LILATRSWKNFAAFAKLLQKRLQHEAPETVDLTGLVLTGFDINARPDDVEDEGKPRYCNQQVQAVVAR